MGIRGKERLVAWMRVGYRPGRSAQLRMRTMMRQLPSAFSRIAARSDGRSWQAERWQRQWVWSARGMSWTEKPEMQGREDMGAGNGGTKDTSLHQSEEERLPGGSTRSAIEARLARQSAAPGM